MIPCEKGSVFGEFWYVTSQKNLNFLLASAIAFPGSTGFRVGAYASDKTYSDPKKYKSLHDAGQVSN
jgi:hypothetical protein